MFRRVPYARHLGWLAAVMLLVTTGAWAQETTGSIGGRVTDAQGLAVPGATITVTGPQGAKSATTDNDGRFSVPFLTPGSYDVRAELQGFKATEQKNVMVRLGQAVDLTLAMQVGGVAETVEVSGSSPVVDTTTTTVGAVISSDLLQRVPIGRKFSDALYIAPGVSDSGVGQANPSVSGGSGLENQYVVDGVNITNAGYGALGSYSIYHGSLGNGVTFDFVKEIQVKTGGYEAEYGQATGGVVNVVTKSGSNNLRGSLFGYIRPEKTEAEWKQLVAPNGVVNTTATSTSDVGAEAGGPAIKDRLFWFAAIDPQWESRTMTAPPDFPLASLGGQERKRHIMSYSSKATLQLSSNHRLDASFFGDPAKGDMGPQRVTSLRRTTTSGYSSLKYGGHNQTVKYDGVFSPKWFVEASVSRAYNNLEETPSVDDYAYSDQTVVPQIASGGLGFYEKGNTGTNIQYQAKSTHVFGGHQVRYGVQYEDITYDNINQYTGAPFTLSNGDVTSTGASVRILPDPNFGKIYRVTRANLNPGRTTTQQYFDFFAQDTWRFGNITLRPGIRYEQQKLVGTLKDFTWKGNWAPRIGGTWDVAGNGRSKVFASWGRFFAKIPNDLAARALSADAGVSRADYFDAGLSNPIPNGVVAGPTGDTQHLILAGLNASDFDPDAKSTYLDESVVGAEYEVIGGMNVGARWIRRRFGRILEDIGTAPMLFYFTGDPNASVEYFITNPGPNTPVVPGYGASFEKAIHEYDAVELTLDKRLANNWQMNASYTWSRLWGDFEGFFRNDNGQSDPAITSLYDFPMNDPSYAEGAALFGWRGDIRFQGKAGAGPLPNDRRHQFKIYGNRTMGDLNVGVGLNLLSGRPLTALAANPAYDNGGEIPEGPRGSGIQTVDGFKKRTPFQSDVNMHADYAIRFGTQRIVLLADIFNLLNRRNATDYDNWTELGVSAPNPDYGYQTVGGGITPSYQSPFQLRVGARFEF